jgi:hypothetical protein
MLLILCIWSLVNLIVFFSLDRKLERLERQRSLVEERLSNLIKKGVGNANMFL